MNAQTTHGERPKNKLVGFPLYNNSTLVDFAGASQVFGSPGSGYEPVWIAKDMSPVTTSEKVSVMPRYTFDNCPDLYMLFVPGGGANDANGEQKNGGVIATMFDEQFLDFLKKSSANATWTGSVCTGAFILAAAGLLKNVSATTYWSVIPLLHSMTGTLVGSVPHGYPRSSIDVTQKRFTGGGISSSIDLALDLLQEIDGVKTANTAQLMIQYQPEPSHQSGDPCHASQELVEEVSGRQQGPFIDPLEAAVQKLLMSV